MDGDRRQTRGTRLWEISVPGSLRGCLHYRQPLVTYPAHSLIQSPQQRGSFSPELWPDAGVSHSRGAPRHRQWGSSFTTSRTVCRHFNSSASS